MPINWRPEVGEETKAFLNHACPETSQDFILNEAKQILGKGVPINSTPNKEIGLVIGYVQSGKTLSFETVLTLAHDNHFPIVVILAGTSNPLLNQSTSRIRRDLRLDEAGRELNWVQLTNPQNNVSDRQHVQSAINTWSGTLPPGVKPRTLLITLLKHPSRIDHLIRLVNACGIKDKPVLILDDEADQASMNAQVNIEEQSRTYESILKLKSCFNKLTYLQYTATPQAPLLINIIDALSPNFVHVLPAGSGYVGGNEFFADDSKNLVIIPPAEVPSRNNHIDEPPQSLIHALMTYVVGATIRVGKGETKAHISMLVHPSHLQDIHKQYCAWVRTIISNWKNIVHEEDGTDYLDLLTDFESAYQELTDTVRDEIPTFSEIKKWFGFVLNELHVEEVNASTGRTPEIPWTTSKFWILVGGQALDRGYTVEGLTVTYMPRGPGVGNADTIQQRARFFGYKQEYFDYCRVYLSEDTIHAYRAYVQHEEDVRNQMLDVQNSGQHLDDWKRSFILDAALRPTRTSVIGGFSRINWSGWTSPKRPLCPKNMLTTNQQVVHNFIQMQDFSDDEGHEARTIGQRHSVSEVSLKSLINNLLSEMRFSDLETKTNHSMLLVHLSKIADDNPDEVCLVYRIAAGMVRTREISEDYQIHQLFQGPNPMSKDFNKGEIYLGDRELHTKNQITVQIHNLNLKRQGKTLGRNVPIVALWIPSALSTSLIYQH